MTLHLADLLSRHREGILRRWEGTSTAAPTSSRASLRQGIREVLDELALTFEPGPRAGNRGPSIRWLGCTLDDVVDAHPLLRDAVWSEWAARSPDGILPAEAHLLHRRLDDAVRAAAASCTRAPPHPRDREGPVPLTPGEQLTDAIERAPMGIAVLDLEARHLMVNAAWRAQTGKRSEEVIGRTPWELWETPEAVEAMAVQIEAMRSQRGIPAVEYSHREGDARRHYRWSFIPLQPIGAMPAGGIALTWDITPEAETRALRERFIHMLTHELRNPLAVLQGNLALITSNADNPDRVGRLGTRLQGTIARMVRMIEELLGLARADHPGGIEVDLREVDVDRVVGEALELLFPFADRTPVVLTLEPGCRARVDADYLVQALENLIRNALTHGRQDAKIQVSVRRAAGAVEISVRNQGPPIPPEELPHVFEPYRRGTRASGSPTREGLGLGLYVVRAVAAAHGGEVTVISTTEDGTTFTLRVPTAASGER